MVSLSDESSFLIFGGFVNGSRVNEIYECAIAENTATWKSHPFSGGPCPRASHSAVSNEDKLYVFGGQDDDNNKLSDCWEFDKATS